MCTCYGTTELDAAETLKSAHHDAPRPVFGPGTSGPRIRPAPFRNHSDEELLLPEERVGRRPPFSMANPYERPRRKRH